MMCEVYFCFWGKKKIQIQISKRVRKWAYILNKTRQTDRIKLIKKLCRFSSLSWTQLKYYGSLILGKKSISQAVLKIYDGYWQIVQILISTLWQLSMLHEIN